MKRAGTVSMLAASVAMGAAFPAAAADSDAEFVKMAASAGMMEVELGKHAAAHGENSEVRAFGKRMAEDHSAAGRELETLAQKEGLAFPKQMTEHDKHAVEELSTKRGADFDEDYLDDMVEGHEDVVAAFRAQASEGKTAVDLWAAKTLPTLEAHLAHARLVDEKVDDAADDDDRAGVRDDAPPVGTEGPRGDPGPMRERLPGSVLP